MAEWDSFIEPEKEIIDRIASLTNQSNEEEWRDVVEEIAHKYLFKHYLCNYKASEESPFPSKRWTIQHHAAHFNAPIEIIQFMVEKHFPMSFKDGEGKTPADHLGTNVDENYKALFKPKFGSISNLNLENLQKIEENFHAVINGRVKDLVEKHNLILPLLSVALEVQVAIEFVDHGWCPIPGMYGGFTIEFKLNEDESDVDHLITSSWCRVAGGSGEKHKCTPEKSELIDSGFV